MTAGYCVGCVEDADCSTGTECRASRCQPYESCRSNRDCVDGGRCAPDSRRCVECVSDTDCGSSSLRCAGQQCVSRCKADSDCPESAPRCAPAGYCVECVAHRDCPSVYHCSHGACELDVCESPFRRCQSDGAGVLECAEAGDVLVLTACEGAASCVDTTNSGPACKAQICTPDAWHCERDTVAARCSADGLSVVETVDCAETDRVCLNGACRAQVCTPGEYSCVDGDLYRCNATGSDETRAEACAPGQHCSIELGAGACVASVCSPNLRTCDGNAVVTCNADGTAYEPERLECADTEVCVAGACLERACDSEYQCQEGSSYRCVENGARLALDQVCDPLGSPAVFCNAGTGRCEPIVCAPAQGGCAGAIATVCLDDGSGYSEDPAHIVDCGALGEACWDGACLPIVCTEPFSCEAAELYRCAGNGTELLLEDTCNAPALCDSTGGSCRPGACTPGEPACDGTRAGICAETGDALASDPAPIDCAEDGQGCLEGECRERTCSAGQYLCIDGDVHLCDDSEASTTRVDRCASGEHCTPGEASCVTDACQPGALLCDSNRATTCLPDGSGPSESGTDCTLTDQLCYLGACRTLACVPNARFCQGGHVRVCNSTGLLSSPDDTCLPSEFCAAIGNAAQCEPDLCNHGRAACDGEYLAICNASGSGYSSRTTNCAASNRVCDLSGQCVATATDAIGGRDFVSDVPYPTLYVTFFEVATARHLVALSLYAGVPSGTSLDFAVYEATTEAGPFTRVFTDTSSATGDPAGALHGPGPFDLALTPARVYAIAALVRSTHQTFEGDSTPPVMSFARALGEFSTMYEGALPAALPETLPAFGTLRQAATGFEVGTR